MSNAILSFEPPTLGGGVVVTNQYDSAYGPVNGVDFPFGLPALPADSQIPLGGYGVLLTRPSPPGAPGIQVASLAGPGEFGDASALGRFNSPHQHVSVLVGAFDSSCDPTLTAYDINGQQVASASATIAAGASAVLDAVSAGAAPDIVFFVIQGADNGLILWITDLTYDLVAGGTPDFLLNNMGAALAQGSSVTVPAQLIRMGGSNGDISLAAEAPLPAGVSVAFSPAVVTGTDSSFSLIFSAAANAPLVQGAAFTISGTPASAAAGPQPRVAPAGVTVEAPFVLRVDAGYAPTLAITACAPVVAQLQFLTAPGFAGGQVSITCTGLPPDIDAVIEPPLVPLGAFPDIALVSVLFITTAQPSANIPIEFVAELNGFSQQVPFTLTGIPTGITSVSAVSGTTPQALQPGAQIVIQGQGFCPGTRVRFGNDLAVVDPDSLSGSEIQVTLPRCATTGVTGPSAETSQWPLQVPFGLVLPDGTSVPSPTAFSVFEYRNVYGFPFKNYYFGGADFDQLTELFGDSATHTSLPFGEVRNPWAITFLGLVNAFLKIGGDICFGMVLATQRLRTNQWGSVNVQDLPTSNLSSYPAYFYSNAGISPPPPAPLSDFIHVQHVAQMSDEWMSYYLDTVLNGGSGTRAYIEGCLRNGDFPLLAMRHGTIGGHVLVAYDIEPNPADPAGYIIDVYDPNEQFIVGDANTAAEDSDSTGVKHRNALLLSQLTVAGNGNWSFPMNANNSDTPPYPAADLWTGGPDRLIPGSSTIIPPTPSLPGLLSSLLFTFEGAAVALGSEKAAGAPGGTVQTVQLSDASGRVLFSSGRVLNRDPATRVQAAPLMPLAGDAAPAEAFVVQSGLAYRHQVRGRTAGHYGVNLAGRPFSVALTAVTAPDQRDELMFDLGSRSLIFKPGAANVPLAAEVTVPGPDGSVRLATLTTRSTLGATETLRFSSDAATLTYEHHGPAASYELRLSALNREGRLHDFSSGARLAADGQTATFTPADWHDLRQVRLVSSAPC